MLRCRYLFVVFLIFFPISLFAESVHELNRQGVNAMRAGSYKDAAKFLKQAMAKDKAYAESYVNFYLLLKTAKKNLAEANKYLFKAYELEPNNPLVKAEYKKLLKEDMAKLPKDNIQAKIDQYKKIFEVDSSEVEVAAEIIKHYFDSKEFDLVRDFSKKVFDENQALLPKYSSGPIGEIFLMLAKIKYEEKDIRGAMKDAEKATRYPIDDINTAKSFLKEVKKAFQEMVDGYFSAGKALMAKEKLDAAKEEFEKGLALDPEHEEIRASLDAIHYKKQAKEFNKEAMRLVEQEKWLEARDKLETVLKFDPKDEFAQKYLKKAIAFEEALKKKLGKADKLPRSTSERADLAESFLRIGKRFLQGKNYKDAQIALDRCVAISEIDSKLSDFKAAAEKELSVITEVNNKSNLWNLAREKYKDRDFEGCIQALDQLPKDYAIDLNSYYAYAYWKTGDNEKAQNAARLQLADQPENNRAKFVLASILLVSGNNSGAHELALQISKSDPSYPGIDDLLYKSGAMSWGPYVIPILIIAVMLYIAYVIHKNMPEYIKNNGIKRGKYFMAKNMFKECIDELSKVRKMRNLNTYDIMIMCRILAQCYLKSGNYERAVGECKQLISSNDKDPEAHEWLGYAYLGKRTVSPESLPELLNLYKKESANKALVSLLGMHYTSQKKLSKEGVEVLERWYEMDKENPDILKSLGKYYLQQGKSDATAMKVFETMMTISTPDISFLLGVAKIRLKKAEYDECMKICEQVITEDVNNELVHPILREAYQKQGKLAELLEIYRVFLAENPYNVAFQKGLSETKKLLDGQAPSQTAPDPLSLEPAANQGEVICPSCSKISLTTDYYCQHCGNSLEV